MTHIKTDDFVEYWAAGRLVLTGGNPYAPDQILSAERGAGWSAPLPLPIFYPPWTLPLVIPFGLLGYPMARILWAVTSVVILQVSLAWMWRFYGGGPTPIWLPFVLGSAFVPVVMMFFNGQIDFMILLGVIGFLVCERQRRDWLAGAFASLLTIKPSLLILFGLGLLVWAIERRRWAVLASVALSCLVGSGVILAVNGAPAVGYLRSEARQMLELWRGSTIGALLRLAFGAEHFWLQFIPPLLGVLWFVPYWRKHHRAWQWDMQATPLLLASIVTMPYGWAHDFMLLLPVVFQFTAGLTTRKVNSREIAAAGGLLAIDGAGFCLYFLVADPAWYVILPICLVLWYVTLPKSLRCTRPELAQDHARNSARPSESGN